MEVLLYICLNNILILFVYGQNSLSLLGSSSPSVCVCERSFSMFISNREPDSPEAWELRFHRPSLKFKSSSGDNSGSCYNASYVPLSPYLPGLLRPAAPVRALGKTA